MTLQERYRGCLVGLAVGDALGVPLEFSERGSKPKVTEMIGTGPFRLKPGEWTDDTSMALCLAKSLIDKDGFDAKDQMNKYWAWVESGYMSSTGEMFDIGGTTSEALCRYRKNGNPFAGLDLDNLAGNGSLMRLAPIPMFYTREIDIIYNAYKSSEVTHAAKKCMSICALYSILINQALKGVNKNDILNLSGTEWLVNLLDEDVVKIFRGSYKTKTEDEIKSTGYVVHTLEAALWAFYNTDTFEDGLIKVINLADDSDTSGAVYGQLAGAYYGINEIPARWLTKLVMADFIVELSDKLYEKRKF